MEKNEKKSKMKQREGFTLIELLTTIVIISLVMGLGAFIVVSLNNNSKEKVSVATKNSIKRSSVDYVTERGKTLEWLSETNESQEEYVCVSLSSLVDYGYFKNNIFNDTYKRSDFVMIRRDKVTKSIISEDFNKTINNVCKLHYLPIPTCKDITYNEKTQKLINNYDENTDNLKMTINDTNIYQTNHGSYDYVFSLRGDGQFAWEDGSREDKKMTCVIKKATCTAVLNDKEVRHNGNEFRYNINELVVKGVGDKVLNNYNDSNVTFNYYKDNTYTTKATNLSSVAEYYVKVDVNLDNYQCSDTSLMDIYTPVVITLNNQSATTAGTSKIYEWHKHAIYFDNELTKKMTTSANKITVPTRTGYTFNGYYTKTNGSGTQLINKTGFITSSFTNIYFAKYATNATLYAYWTANKYNITLNNQSATTAGTGTIYLKYNTGVYFDSALTKKMTTSANKITVPTRTGYTFGGYYTKTNGGGTQLINASGFVTSNFKTTLFSANTTLYAKWTANKYKVTFNPNGGSVNPTSTTVTYNSTYGTLPTPTRTNYQFLGWYTATSGGTKITSSTKVTITAAQTLYARWAKELQVGDYVSYTPSSASYNWNSNYSGYSGTYAEDGFPSTTISNTNSNYKITSWRVLSINGNTIELVAASPTVGKVVLYGAQGYNNGVKLLNDACSTLYSNSSKGISARSVRLEDITSRLTSSALTEINNYVEKSYKLGTSKKYTSKRYYPVMYASEKGSIINGTTKTTGLGPSEQSSFIEKTASGATNGRLRASSSITVTETYWYKYISFFKTAFKANGNATSSLYCDLFFPKGAKTEYWLATRFNILGNDLATFQMAYISTDDGGYESYVGGKKLLASNGTFYWDVYELFPLLTLNKSAITYTVSGNTTSYSIK